VSLTKGAAQRDGNGRVYDDALYKPFALSRLTDYDPSHRTDAHSSLSGEKQALDDILENVRMLFSSRSHPTPEDLAAYPELRTSVLNYGISDYCGRKTTENDIEQLRQHIIEQLQCFEGRLDPESIVVESVVGDEVRKTLLDFKICGIIRIGQISREFRFISKLDFETGCASLEAL
jgi:type VI secretion system protein ImpF